MGEGAARATGRALARPEAREPLPLGAQAALGRALGADVGHVRIIRDAHAAAATAEAAADALAVGDAVLLSPGQDLASPRGLGLLAHELTHILRDREPGFVPAVLRPSAVTGRVSRTLPLAGPAPADEEALAEQVEARVGAQMAAQTPAAQTPAAQTPAAQTPAVQAPVEGTAPAATRSVAGRAAPWGDLPAPWEALPFWEDAPAAPLRAGPPRPLAWPGPGPVAASAPAPSAGGQVVRAASTARSVPAPTQAAAAQGGEGADPLRGPDTGSSRQQARAPDLDRLAEQVYGVLKRRLATEMRRDR